MKREKANMKKYKQSGDPGNWLLTLNDLLTLIFTFFVLLLAFSSLQGDYLVQTVDSFRKTLAGGPAAEGGRLRIFKPFVTPVKDPDIEAEKARDFGRREGEAMLRLRPKLMAFMTAFPQGAVAEWPRGMELQIPLGAVFDFPDGEIGPEGGKMLARLREVVKQERAFIHVEVIAAGASHEAARRAAAIASTMTVYEGEQAERVSASGFEPGKDQPTARDGRIRILVATEYI